MIYVGTSFKPCTMGSKVFWSLITNKIFAILWDLFNSYSNSVFQPVKFTSTLQKLLATFFQIFDIWWSSLDIMDDFKLISRTVIFHLGEINNIMIFSFVKKNFFSLFLVRYYISNYKKNISIFFFQNWKKKIFGKKFLKIFFIILNVITN